MAKKKEVENTNSVALFDDVIETSVKPKKNVKKADKQSKSSSKSDSKVKTNKLTKEKKSSPKSSNKKEKKNEPTTKSNSKKPSKSKSASIDNDNSSSRTKKKDIKQSGAKSKRLKDSKQEPKTTARRTAKSTSVSKGLKKSSDKSGDVSKKSKSRSSTVEHKLAEESRKSKRTVEREVIASEDTGKRKRDREVESNEQKDGSDNFKLYRKAAKREARELTFTDRISTPQVIEAGPNPVKDDFSIVEIIIGGKMKFVSPWSIKNGMYYEGLDSNFLVSRLKYVRPEDDPALAEFNKSLGTKYKDWEKASHHKNIDEPTLMKFGDKLDWSILFKTNDMNKYSKKVKKKFSAEYASAVTLE